MGTPFELDTAVARSAPGRYIATVTDRWNAPVLPQGGVTAAIALRAMSAELDEPELKLRSMHVVFAAQVPAGPVDVEVGVLRRGRSMSQAAATVRSVDADAGHTALAAFGRQRPGFAFTDITPPVVAPPEECPSFRDPPPPDFERLGPPASFWEQIECRVAIGTPPWDAQQGGATSERAYWYRFDEPPRTDDGALETPALVALCDTMPGAVFERVGFQDVVMMVPSVDLTVHVFGDSRSEWLLAHNFARYAGDGYASLEMRCWDPEGGLVAYTTQMMFFSFPDGPPAGAQ